MKRKSREQKPEFDARTRLGLVCILSHGPMACSKITHQGRIGTRRISDWGTWTANGIVALLARSRDWLEWRCCCCAEA